MASFSGRMACRTVPVVVQLPRRSWSRRGDLLLRASRASRDVAWDVEELRTQRRMVSARPMLVVLLTQRAACQGRDAQPGTCVHRRGALPARVRQHAPPVSLEPDPTCSFVPAHLCGWQTCARCASRVDDSQLTHHTIPWSLTPPCSSLPVKPPLLLAPGLHSSHAPTSCSPQPASVSPSTPALPQMFSLHDWRRHRSASRFWRHLQSIPTSGVIRGVLKPTLIVVVVTAGGVLQCKRWLTSGPFASLGGMFAGGR